MISVLQHGPARRTYEEEDEDANALNFVEPAERAKVEWSSAGGASLRTNLLIVATCLHSKPFCQSILKSFDMAEVGRIVSGPRKVLLATLFHSALVNCVVMSVDADVPLELGNMLAQLVEGLEPSHTIVLGEIRLASYNGRAAEGQLVLLTTPNSGIQTSVSPLECENVVSSVGAAFLTHAAARERSAALFLTISRPHLQEPAMRAFTQMQAAIQALTGKELMLPSASDYAAVIRRDPYVFKTENMYS